MIGLFLFCPLPLIILREHWKKYLILWCSMSVLYSWAVKCVAKLLQSNWARPWRKHVVKLCLWQSTAWVWDLLAASFLLPISRICSPLAWWLQIFIRLLVPSHFLPSHISEGSAFSPLGSFANLRSVASHETPWAVRWARLYVKRGSAGWSQKGMLSCPCLERLSVGS